MATKIRSTKKSEIHKLRTEVAALRSYIIGVVGRDVEGGYRPEFVRQVLADSEEKSVATFASPDQFLNLLDKTEK